MTNTVPAILGETCEEFTQRKRDTIAADRARKLYRAFFRDGCIDAIMDDAPPPPPAREQREDETIKFTLPINEQHETESVLIPMQGRSGNRTQTLCVSSQIGCAMGCGFCETAQMGLRENLSAAQIVAQWWSATHQLGARVRNVVFMGMGEPMDNLEAVMQSIRVLADHNGPSIAAARIAVSTVGRVDGIKSLGEFVREPGFHRLGLAVSINAPNDEVRSQLMPINRAWPMHALRAALENFPRYGGSAILAEYVLIPGVNDSNEACDELCDWLRPLHASLNVIPYNPRRNSPWPAPRDNDVDRFVQRAITNGQFVKRRGTKGRNVMAACGQLGNPELRRRTPVPAPILKSLTINASETTA